MSIQMTFDRFMGKCSMALEMWVVDSVYALFNFNVQIISLV